MTRDVSAARNPTGNTVPSVIGTSPKMSPGRALADDALDPVDKLDRLDAALEHGEERALVALVRGVLARHEADVGRRAGKPLALGSAESREDRDSGDLVRRHHEQHSRRLGACHGPAAARRQPGNGRNRLAFTWGQHEDNATHPNPCATWFGVRAGRAVDLSATEGGGGGFTNAKFR